MFSEVKNQAAPWCTWPDHLTTSTALNFGNFGGFAHSQCTPQTIKWEFANASINNGEPEIYQLSPIVQTFPHTRRYSPINVFSDNTKIAKEYAAQSAQSLQSINPEFDIEQEFIEDTFFNEACNENGNKKYDPYMSSQLISIGDYEEDTKTLGKFIAFPMGIAGTDLNLIPILESYDNELQSTEYNIGQHKLNLPAMTTLKFKTPIRQITSSISEKWQFKLSNECRVTPSFLAVRTMTGTTFFWIANSESDDSFNTIQGSIKPAALDTICDRTSFEHTHVAFNPKSYGEAAIVDCGGGVYLWRAERHEAKTSKIDKYEVETIRSPHLQEDEPLKELWQTCDFGAHPRCLYVASRERVDLFDFRNSHSTKPLNMFSAIEGNQIYAFQHMPFPNAFQSILVTDSKVILLDQRFPKRPLLSLIHYNIDLPVGLNTLIDKQTSTVLTWSKNPPKITAFQIPTSESGLITATGYPISIPSFHTHPTYCRSKYLRVPNPLRLHQLTEEFIQPQTLPPLASVLLLPNNIRLHNAIKHKKLGSCFSVIQLSQTGALYSQTFYSRLHTSVFPQAYMNLDKDMQIVEMPSSVASLQFIADQDVGTNYELQLKHYKRWPFEKIWNYVTRDFKLLQHDNGTVLEIGAMFLSWKHVENFFENYSHEMGFCCRQKSITADPTGTVRSITYVCSEGAIYERSNRIRKIIPCKWKVVLYGAKTDTNIYVTKFNNKHNHKTFSPIFRSNSVKKTTLLSNDYKFDVQQIFSQVNQDNNISTWENFFCNKIEMVDNFAHPMTLYEILKNMPGIQLKDRTKISCARQFCNLNNVIENRINEISIDWANVDLDALFEQLSIVSNNFCLVYTVPEIYGFPHFIVTDDNKYDKVKDIKTTLRNTYPLPLRKKKKETKTALQRKIKDFLNGSYHSEINDNIQSLREFAIEELIRDLTFSSYSLASKYENNSGYSLSSNLLPVSKVASTFEPFAIKCDASCKDKNKLSQLDNLLKLTPNVQALFDDWVIGQDIKEYEYHYQHANRKLFKQTVTTPEGVENVL